MKQKTVEHRLAERMYRIKPSATMAIDAKAKKLQQKGGDIINLGVGEPDFDTPQHIKAAAIEAINAGFTKYTAVGGTLETKEAVCLKYERENQLNFTPDNIVISNGAKQVIFNLVQALINPGEEVIIPAPYWVSYPDIVTMAEGKSVIVETSLSSQFKINAEQLKEAITANTKLLILNSPSNPSGMSYSKEEIAELAQVLIEHPHVYILCDDIYEHIVWTSSGYTNLLSVCPELADRTILVNGVSKAYAMTGWRIGYAAAPIDIIKGMTKMQSQSTSNPNSVAQKATVAALTSDQQCIKDMVKKFRARHDFVLQGLSKITGVKIIPNNGTFYAFPDFSDIIADNKNFSNDIELADYLLNKAGIAVVPGTAFGAPGCIRLSYATSTEKLEDALKRMKTLLG